MKKKRYPQKAARLPCLGEEIKEVTKHKKKKKTLKNGGSGFRKVPWWVLPDVF
jgi:hypothetical protein